MSKDLIQRSLQIGRPSASAALRTYKASPISLFDFTALSLLFSPLSLPFYLKGRSFFFVRSHVFASFYSQFEQVSPHLLFLSFSMSLSRVQVD